MQHFPESLALPGASWISSSWAQWWRSALPHCRRPPAETAVQPRSPGHQPRRSGRGPRERRQHRPAPGPAALSPEGEPRAASGSDERDRRHSPAGSVFRRMPSGACAWIHAPGAGEVPGRGDDRDGSAASGEEQGEEERGGTFRWRLRCIIWFGCVVHAVRIFNHS